MFKNHASRTETESKKQRRSPYSCRIQRPLVPGVFPFQCSQTMQPIKKKKEEKQKQQRKTKERYKKSASWRTVIFQLSGRLSRPFWCGIKGAGSRASPFLRSLCYSHFCSHTLFACLKPIVNTGYFLFWRLRFPYPACMCLGALFRDRLFGADQGSFFTL